VAAWRRTAGCRVSSSSSSRKRRRRHISWTNPLLRQRQAAITNVNAPWPGWKNGACGMWIGKRGENGKWKRKKGKWKTESCLTLQPPNPFWALPWKQWGWKSSLRSIRSIRTIRSRSNSWRNILLLWLLNYYVHLSHVGNMLLHHTGVLEKWKATHTHRNQPPSHRNHSAYNAAHCSSCQPAALSTSQHTHPTFCGSLLCKWIRLFCKMSIAMLAYRGRNKRGL